MIKRPIPTLSRINSARATTVTTTIGDTGKKQSKAPMGSHRNARGEIPAATAFLPAYGLDTDGTNSGPRAIG
jgi:hypothetical protein